MARLPVRGCRECAMARICRHSAILVRPHARTLLHDLRVYQLAPKADEHGFGFPRLLALSCRAPMARPSPLWARGFGSGAVRPCYPLGWPRRQCGGAYTVPGNKLVRESAGGHNLRGARASLLTCQLYGASLEPRPADSLRTGLFLLSLEGQLRLFRIANPNGSTNILKSRRSSPHSFARIMSS
jgi:hypothetical protein